MPSKADERAMCRLLELFADEIMIVSLRALVHRTGPRPADPDIWAEWERQAEAAERHLNAQFAFLTSRLGAASFCGQLSFADIVLFCSTLYAQWLGGPPIAPLRAMGNWYRRLRDRQIFAQISEEIRITDLELSSPVARAQAY
jgi:glutathione S-transferase